MKKIFLFLIAVAAALPSYASAAGSSSDSGDDYRYGYGYRSQDRYYRDYHVRYSNLRHEIRIGYSGYPLFDAENFIPVSSAIYDVAEGFSISSLYRDYSGPVYMTGLVSAEFNFVMKRWFTMSVGLFCNGIWGNTMDGATGVSSRDSGVSMTLMPQARFTYFTREYVKLYSAVGLGVGYGQFRGTSKVFASLHTVPFGVMVGGRVFGFAECHLGTLSMGGGIGLGVRF